MRFSNYDEGSFVVVLKVDMDLKNFRKILEMVEHVAVMSEYVCILEQLGVSADTYPIKFFCVSYEA